MLNEELLRAGLAKAMLRYNYSDSVKRRYRAAQKEAQEARRGIWSGEKGPLFDESDEEYPAREEQREEALVP